MQEQRYDDNNNNNDDNDDDVESGISSIKQKNSNISLNKMNDDASRGSNWDETECDGEREFEKVWERESVGWRLEWERYRERDVGRS